MIALYTPPDYDDEGIFWDCRDGWRRFCADVLCKAAMHVRALFARRRITYARQGRAMEILRRQVAAYRWVTENTGGEFTFDQTCEDLGLCAAAVRRQILAVCPARQDINLLVDWVSRQKERLNDSGPKTQASGRMGTSLATAVRDFNRANPVRKGGGGSRPNLFCCYKNVHADGRRIGRARQGRAA